MEHLGKPIYSEYNNKEFLHILDDYGNAHTAIHESARRIRILLARIQELETATRVKRLEFHHDKHHEPTA